MGIQDHDGGNAQGARSGGSKARETIGAQGHVDANASADNPKSIKARRRPPARPADTGKRSLNLRVDDDTYERLTVHAIKQRKTISELVIEFAKNHLREYSVHRNGARTEPGE